MVSTERIRIINEEFSKLTLEQKRLLLESFGFNTLILASIKIQRLVESENSIKLIELTDLITNFVE